MSFRALRPEAVPPRVMQPGDAGADLASAEALVVPARGRRVVATGIALELPPGFRAVIRSRSGLSLRHGIECGAGLIDEGFRDELRVLLYNHGDADFAVAIGDRIAQICVERYCHPVFEPVEALSETGRGGGWGSSGTQTRSQVVPLAGGASLASPAPGEGGGA